MKPQLQILDSMYQAILDSGIEQNDAFHKLMEFIGNRLKLEEPIPSPWLKNDTCQKLDELFDLDVLQQDQWDWIGELHAHRDLSLIKGVYNIDREAVEKQLSLILPSIEKDGLSRVLDPIAGTGRGILRLAIHYPEALYYLAEMDVIAYRITILNMKMYNIRAVILNANSKTHDLREYSPNWRYANRWHPVKEKKLFSEGEVNERVYKEDTYKFN